MSEIRIGALVLFCGVEGRIERRVRATHRGEEATLFQILLLNGMRHLVPAGDLAFPGEDEREEAAEVAEQHVSSSDGVHYREATFGPPGRHYIER